MKRHNLSHTAITESPLLVSQLPTAHSGPELVGMVPQSQLAREIAQALLCDHMQLVQSSPKSLANPGSQFTISFSRR